jgi:hypothetical protein
MPRVAGVLTAERQTPLSHVNLRAVQDDVPNAFVKDAATDQAIRALVGKYVRYEVRADGYVLREATSAEVDHHFAKLRPTEPRVPARDLTVLAIRPLAEISFGDAAAFGVKTANLAALRALDLPDGVVPDGYGVPFRFYDEFMKHNGLYDEARRMRASPGFAGDAAVREKALAAFRREVEKAAMPDWMAAAFRELERAFPNGTTIRCRSSTNNEDLPGFSGAGLYDSFSHGPKEGRLAKTIRQVFASLWNFRAYEEREFLRIDHFAAAMGVLLHPSYGDEKVNGVAVTDDVVYQTGTNLGRRYYVNALPGEQMVTNPKAGSVPEELLLHPSRSGQDTVVRTSSGAGGGSLLTDAQVDELRACLNTIHRAFRKHYGRKVRDRFAMEVEFKITTDGKLAIKQARPWVY